MKDLFIGGHAITSIWKSNDTKSSKESGQSKRNNGRVYADPTANAVIGRMMREERMARKKKQQGRTK